jgi:HSP20 family protein
MISGFDDPFAAMLSFQRALESRFESDWMSGSTAGVGAYPPINIFEQGDDFVAVIELPGVGKDDLQIEAKENTIRISGTKAVTYDQNVSMHRRERRFGLFDRTIALPVEVDVDHIRAEYNEGVLSLFIPRSASAKPRTIKIN